MRPEITERNRLPRASRMGGKCDCDERRRDLGPLYAGLAGAIVAMLLLFWADGAIAQEQYKRELRRAAYAIWGLDAPVATFAAQIQQESAWRPDAVSYVGASGMSQFMPATARWICGAYPELPAGCDTTNPTWAMRALVTYDKHLYDRLKIASSECNRMWAALRSYNGGEGHWRKEAALTECPMDRYNVDAQCGKASRSVKHCAENLGYPQRIIERHQPRFLTWGRGVCLP